MKDIEVPTEKYDRYCSSCMHSHGTKETVKDIIHQSMLPPSERGKIRLRCSRRIPCADVGTWIAEVAWGRVRPKKDETDDEDDETNSGTPDF